MNFINAIISFVVAILGNIIAAWLQPKLENWKKITIFIFLVLASYSLISTLFQKVEEIPKQVESIRTQTNIQTNNGTVNNIENQTINNNYAPQNADNKIVVKENKIEKELAKDIFLEIPIRLDSKSKGYFSIYVDGENAVILPNSTEFNPWISIKSIPNKNQKIIIITNSGDTCFVNNVFDEKYKNDFPPNFNAKCKN